MKTTKLRAFVRAVLALFVFSAGVVPARTAPCCAASCCAASCPMPSSQQRQKKSCQIKKSASPARIAEARASFQSHNALTVAFFTRPLLPTPTLSRVPVKNSPDPSPPGLASPLGRSPPLA